MTVHAKRCTAAMLFVVCSLAVADEPLPPPPPPSIEARAYVLMDFHSGEILAERAAGDRVEPASLTKIMTIYTVAAELHAGRIALDDEVLVSEKAWRTGGSRMFIEVGDRVRVEDLMKGDIIQSGNDASVALAEYVSGTEEVFAALMNQHAQRLGLAGTHYVNSTGLPHPEHYTTAMDVAKLSAALIRDFPEIYAWFSELEFTWNGIKQPNRNRLLRRDDSVDGIKTGYTEAAGYCLAASAARDGRRLIAVVLGAGSDAARTRAASALLSYGFRFFETHRLYAAGEPVTRVPVWKGEQAAVAAGLDADLYVTVPRGHYERLDAQLSLEPRLIAPVAAGDRLGTLAVTLGGEEIAVRPLLALEELPAGGLLTRMLDEVRLWFQ